MQALEREAVAAGFRLLVLDSKRGDAGEQLYRALGWTVVGTIPRFALDTGAARRHTATPSSLLQGTAGSHAGMTDGG